MIAFLLACSVAPMDTVRLRFLPLDAPPDVAVVFPDDTWVRGDVGTLGGESMVRVEGVEILRSDDRGRTWTDLAPTRLFEEVVVAGQTLAVIEQSGDPWIVHVSLDGGSSFTRREFAVGPAALRQWTARHLVVQDGEDTPVFELDLTDGSITELGTDRWFARGRTLVAPNGAVVYPEHRPPWEPHQTAAVWTDRPSIRHLPQDLDLVLAAGITNGRGGSLGYRPWLFTNDSRLVVADLDGALFVSEVPLAMDEDQSASILVGPGCDRVDLSLPRAAPSPDTARVENGGTEALRVWGLESGSYRLRGELQPGETVSFPLDVGLPWVAETLDGTCVHARSHTGDAETAVVTP